MWDGFIHRRGEMDKGVKTLTDIFVNVLDLFTTLVAACTKGVSLKPHTWYLIGRWMRPQRAFDFKLFFSRMNHLVYFKFDLYSVVQREGFQL